MPNNRTRMTHHARKCRNNFDIVSGSRECGQDIWCHATFQLQSGSSIAPG